MLTLAPFQIKIICLDHINRKCYFMRAFKSRQFVCAILSINKTRTTIYIMCY